MVQLCRSYRIEIVVYKCLYSDRHWDTLQVKRLFPDLELEIKMDGQTIQQTVQIQL